MELIPGSDCIYVDPVIEAYKKDVDVTLLHENLNRSVEERFQKLKQMYDFWRAAQAGKQQKDAV
jgi:hypothetical protein